MTGTTVLTKERVAANLARAAAAAFLAGRHLEAVVLGGAAEDLFAGLLKREGREKEQAREDLRPAINAFLPVDRPISNGALHGLQRATFNWLRHNDQEDEQQEIEVDLFDEARTTVERALKNELALTGREPAELTAIVRASRGADF